MSDLIAIIFGVLFLGVVLVVGVEAIEYLNDYNEYVRWMQSNCIKVGEAIACNPFSQAPDYPRFFGR